MPNRGDHQSVHLADMTPNRIFFLVAPEIHCSIQEECAKFISQSEEKIKQTFEALVIHTK